MAFKLPMNGFKKVSEDKNKTVLKHESGHEITIAHSPLSPKMRSQLKALPTAEPTVHTPSENAASLKKTVQMKADGGKIQDSPHNTIPNTGASDKTPKSNTNDDYQVGEQNSIGSRITKGAQNMVGGYADGGEVATPDATPAADTGISSMGSMIGHAVTSALSGLADKAKSFMEPSAQASEPAAVPAQPQASPVVAQAQQALEQSSQPTTPTAQAQQAPDMSNALPQEPGTSVPNVGAQNQPGLEEGYANQVKGLNSQAQAQAAQGQRDAANFQATAGQEHDLLTQFQQHSNDMNTEIQNTMNDINQGHIDPQHFWADKSGFDRARIGIGMVLSGMGSGITGQPNLAVDMLNRNIDRDIDAQKANLGKKENLLGAMFKQYGNMRDATDMTRTLLSSQLQNQIAASAAQAQGPTAKAAAQQAIGKLQEQISPVMYQMNMRRTLQSINQGGTGQPGSPAGQGSLSHVDPATFLNIVPEPQQKAVADEISRAQDTRHMSNQIMQNFEEAVKDTSGIGALTSRVKDPRSINAMHQALQPTFKDLEGTVRQAAMDNTFKNVTPNSFDTARDVATKRQALQNYILSKQSAPLAKSYGIDLQKFSSTNSTPYARLNPQQQQFADWAKANPSNPKAAMVLKKLGIE